MLIDSLSIQKSSHVAVREGNPLTRQADVITAVYEAVKECGWTTRVLFAGAGVIYPFGAPAVSGPGNPIKKPCGCGTPFLTIGAANFVPYNPYTETPVNTSGCYLFAIGDNAAATLANLADAVIATGLWLAVVTAPVSGPELLLTITSVIGGPGPNYTACVADGRWGVAAQINGGGYELTSVEERDGAGRLRTSSFSVRLTSAGGTNWVSSHITQPINVDIKTPYNAWGSNVLYLDSVLFPDFRASSAGVSIGGAAGYRVIANPYSFCLYVPDLDSATAVFAAAPYIPTEESFQSAYAAVWIFPTVGAGMAWRGATVALDAAPVSNAGLAGFPRVVALRAPGKTALTTPSGKPVITTAWLMYGPNAAAAPSVVGRLWDCAVVNDVVGSTCVIDGQQYMRISTQDGSGGRTRCSLVMRTGN